MLVVRPPWGELEVVASGELIFRFVQPNQYSESAVAGARVQPSALQTNEFTPNEKSYGASVYVKARLLRGLEDLYEAMPKWRGWRVAEIPVSSINELGVEVRLSPQDCQIETIRHAHASLIGVTKAVRNKLIKVIEANLVGV